MTSQDDWQRSDKFAISDVESSPRLNAPKSTKLVDPFEKFLGLLDLDILNAIQFSIFRSQSGFVGKRAPWGQSLLLGHGGSFAVRRVPYDPYEHHVAVWDDSQEPKGSKFVVFKQPLLSNINPGKEEDVARLQAVLTEMKILYHQPIRKHPNIVKLLQLRWDTQDGPNLIAPSLVLEHANLGSLSAFQDPGRVILHSTAKMHICLDIAEGLHFLHRCGIVHGDVKSENILLFMDDKVGYRAKLSDFGCSLIEVFDDSKANLKDLKGHTKAWCAPEYKQLDPTGLRQTDIYSYGLMVWRISLNGVEPYRYLRWETEEKAQIKAMKSPHSQDGKANALALDDFDKIKRSGDMLLHLALQMLRGGQASDFPWTLVRDILVSTIQEDTRLRATSFAQIIGLFAGGRCSNNRDSVQPKPLKLGDFGIFSRAFAHEIHNLATAPPEFRRLVCNMLAQASNSLPESDVRKGQSCLALALCQIQGFCPNLSEHNPVELIYKAASLGNITAQSLATRIPNALKNSFQANPLLIFWLQNSMRHGFEIARRDLQQLDKTKYEETARSITENSHSLSEAILRSTANDDLLLQYLQNSTICSQMDPVTLKWLSKPGNSTLHCAAYLGYKVVFLELAERSETLDKPNCEGQTPLHYASIRFETEVVDLLLSMGADANASTILNVSPLHYAALSPNTEISELLLKSGAILDTCSKAEPKGLNEACIYPDYYHGLSGSALNWAIKAGNLGTARFLLERGADPNVHDPNSSILSPIETALYLQSLDSLRLLMPYTIASPSGLPEFKVLVPFLLGQFSTPVSRILYQSVPVEAFVFPAIQILEENGVTVDERGVLCQALDDGVVAVADHYIKKLGVSSGVDNGFYKFTFLRSEDSVDIPIDLDYFLETAVLCGKSELVTMILGHKRRLLSSSGPSGDILLGKIGSRTSLDEEEMERIAIALVSYGADVTAVDKWGLGPLHRAAQWNRLGAIQVLLRLGATTEDARKAFCICLQDAYTQISPAILTELINQRPGILSAPLNRVSLEDRWSNVQTYDDANYLRLLCRASEPQVDEVIVVQMLKGIIEKLTSLPNGAQILRERLDDQAEWCGYSALHVAALTGKAEAARVLLDAGDSINRSCTVVPFQMDDLEFDLPGLILDNPLAEAFSGSDLIKSPWLASELNRASAPLTIIELTPLDVALSRDWQTLLHNCAYPALLKLIEKIEWANGDSEERQAFERRTTKTVQLLRDRGGRTRFELMGHLN